MPSKTVDSNDFNALVPAVHRASTLTFPSVKQFLQRRDRLLDGFSYGLYGTPTVRALEAAVAETEGGSRSILVPSGLAALTHTLLALVGRGDHLLVADCVYGPTRDFCNSLLARFGVDVEFFPATAGGDLAERFRGNTRAIVLESPGSYTMEIQDLGPLTAAARSRGILTLLDNTWGFGLCSPFAIGIDISAVALSKYAGGHSDLCLGAVTVANPALFARLKLAFVQLGTGVSSDDAYLGMRGMQTLGLRLKEQAARAATVADWLAQRPEVQTVLYPPRPGDAMHARWQHYYRGGTGLLAMSVLGGDRHNLAAMIDGYEHFRIGASWGGTHSLVALADVSTARTAVRLPSPSWIVRLHIGLEPMPLLLADLEAGFARLAACQPSIPH